MSPNRTPTPRISGSKTLRAVALAVAVAVSPLAAPQFIGSEVSKPWTASPFKLNPKTRVKLDLRSASIDGVIAWFQNTTGITIVKDPSLTGPFPLTSAKAVPLTDAFQIFSTALGLKGYDLRKQENLLVIRKRDQGGGGGGGGPIGFPGGNNGNNNDFGADNQTVLQVYPVTYANASQVARIVNSVFANSGSQNFGGFRFGSNQAGAVDIEAALQGRGGFGGGQRGGFGGQGGQQRGGFPGGFNRGGQQASLVQADYDDYSNQVIVNAPQRFQSQVRDLIKQLDKLTDDPTTTKVYHLQFANATEAVATIQQVLSANVPRGKGGATTAQTSGPGGFLSALRGQTAGSGTATADIRTNNVVVTATPENIKIVDRVIQEIDQNIPVESTTFVFPLNNAKADEVATLLQSAFGTRTGVNGGRVGGTTTAGRTSTTSNSNNNNRNSGGGQRLGAQVQGNDLALAMDPNADGELETSVGVTQNFGQGFFGGQGRTGTNGTQTRTVGTNSSGQVVNTRDLSNQVTAIADTNTNSLIVVTSPENAAIIKAILDQLDKIPEQVLIETIIVEATLSASDKLGVEWSYTGGGTNRSNVVTDYNNVGATASTTNDNQGFRYTLTGTNYSVFVNALKADSKFQVLSTPKIFTSNGVEAEINISQSLPYITSSIQNVNGTFTNNYQFTDVGIVLTVTPRITSNGFVAMDVQQTANDLQGYTSFNAPIINQRIANTRVSVKDGETIILGGIIRNAVTTDVRKVPVLGDIPVLGQLFRSNVKTKEKTELLVFLTPRVVRDSDEARRLREDEERKISPESDKAFNDYIRKGNNDKNKTPERTVPPVTTPRTGGGTGTGTPPPAGGGNPR